MKISVKNIAAIVTLTSLTAIANNTKAQQITSDSLKENVTPVSYSLAVINQLEPISYQYNQKQFKQLGLPKGEQFGFATNNMQQVLPTAVKSENYWYTAGKNNQRAVTTTKADLEVIMPLLVGAIKDQQAQIDALKKEVQALKQK